MDNNNTEISANKGKIVALIFVALMVLPLCYVAIKEYRLSRQAKQNATPATATPKQP